MSTSMAIHRQLYLREQSNQSLIELNDLETVSIELKEFNLWVKSKRKLTLSNIEGRTWVKTCSGGYITELTFFEDGNLIENRLFDRFETKGQWNLVDGLLKVTIFKGNNRYDFTVIGNHDVNIHSAIEYKNNELHSYLKLMQIEQP
ncbi:hypothetical protein [Vibrio sp. 99-70-13A1]|uniref:hypothetical protein n=1 Tax=Vibrio sp. 99-70-13A1 TaxID=2607601 RepID=UPI001493938E|nr:hypothetical protein [Vibrio sp. 99-70-13A1]NOH98555.1 hypothetical protein [Vibrio sp. 99-70-13A1]